MTPDCDFIAAMSAGIPPLTQPDPIAADEAAEGACAQCETCGGVGTYDERLGGEFFSNPRATCPDCDGHGICAMGLPELTDSEMAEGHLTEERR